MRKAMSDYFAGQRFFEFYPGDAEDDSEQTATVSKTPVRSR